MHSVHNQNHFCLLYFLLVTILLNLFLCLDPEEHNPEGDSSFHPLVISSLPFETLSVDRHFSFHGIEHVARDFGESVL